MSLPAIELHYEHILSVCFAYSFVALIARTWFCQDVAVEQMCVTFGSLSEPLHLPESSRMATLLHMHELPNTYCNIRHGIHTHNYIFCVMAILSLHKTCYSHLRQARQFQVFPKCPLRQALPNNRHWLGSLLRLRFQVITSWTTA